ncbi:MAG: 50S ribosomal protein L1 [Patescibacteria group bacterium]|nr:50S ribosomal protein L1 [Patescibacteria group bacterium]
MKKSKRYRSVKDGVEKNKVYPLAEAIELVKKCSTAKFDESIEMHIRLGIDVKKADQQVRATAQLPHPTGRKLVIAVFANDSDQAKAKDAGASIVGGEELIKEIKTTEKTKFDLALATPEMMRKLGPIAKILGTKGLMPNPKNETVTNDVAKTIKDLQSGKVAFRSDETGNVHQIIGKASFEAKMLADNAKAFIDAIRRVKPDGSKGIYVRNVTLTSTMGPGIRIII